MLRHQLRIGIALASRAFLDVADVEHRLRGQQAEHAEGALFFRLALQEARRLALAQQHQSALHQVELLLGVLVVALGLLGQVIDALLAGFEIGEHQLGLDDLDVGERIDLAFDMGDVVIDEAAHDVRDGIGFADGGEELVAEAFALGGALHQTRDIDEGQARRDDLLRLADLGELVQPFVRHRDLADIRLDGAERIVRRLGGRGFGERIEQRRFADIRQPDDTAFKSHDLS